jgi:hypothetical protein
MKFNEKMFIIAIYKNKSRLFFWSIEGRLYITTLLHHNHTLQRDGKLIFISCNNLIPYITRNMTCENELSLKESSMMLKSKYHSDCERPNKEYYNVTLADT